MRNEKSLNERLIIVYIIILIFAFFATLNSIIMAIITNVQPTNLDVETYNHWLNYIPIPFLAILFTKLTYVAALEKNGVTFSTQKHLLSIIINIVLVSIIVLSIICLEFMVYPTWE